MQPGPATGVDRDPGVRERTWAGVRHRALTASPPDKSCSATFGPWPPGPGERAMNPRKDGLVVAGRPMHECITRRRPPCLPPRPQRGPGARKAAQRCRASGGPAGCRARLARELKTSLTSQCGRSSKAGALQCTDVGPPMSAPPAHCARIGCCRAGSPPWPRPSCQASKPPPVSSTVSARKSIQT